MPTGASDATPGFADRVAGLFGSAGTLAGAGRFLLDLPARELGGVQPAFGGLDRGAGTTFGLSYEPSFLQRPGRFVQARLLASLNRYYGGELRFGDQAGPYVRYAYARYHHRPEESFFGIGPDSRLVDESVYRLNETVVGGLLGRRIGDDLLVGSHAAYRGDRHGTGRGSEPAVQSMAGEAALPGMNAGADYVMVGSFFEYDTRDIETDAEFARRFAPTERRLRNISLDARSGTYLSTQLTHHIDVRHNRHSFTRLTVDAQEYLPIRNGAQHGLVLRQFVSMTHAPGDRSVPFYRLQTLGGSRSLRGYTSGRFRDRNVAMVNAELRCQVWHWLDMAFFGDAGHVFREVDDLGLDGLRYDYGVGLRVRTGGDTVVRFDVARSPEGLETHLKFGSLL
jgi:hypothetical protein